MTSGVPKSGGLNYRARPGKLEQAVARELKEASGVTVPWIQTLTQLALLDARIIDQARLHGPLPIISPMQGKLLEVLDRIRAVAPPPAASEADDVEAFVNGLSQGSGPAL